ncbi:discoidin domain-containing protein, partial [Salmonella sp. s51944]|uniref:discoidin domain-containing protein n=1 Tax=Salmonella sp. s51944 TaxID=3159655 RepID=UPI003980A827
ASTYHIQYVVKGSIQFNCRQFFNMALLQYTSICIIMLLSAISMTIGEETSSYCGRSANSCCERWGINKYSDPKVVVTSSSNWDANHGPDRAKLFEVKTAANARAGWNPRSSDGNQWIQVDFGKSRKVNGILLQGRGDYPQWVKSFRVLFSNDNNDFYSTEVIEGNFDQNTVARRFFDRPIVARYFRINPVTWQGSISIRFDLLGCSAQIKPSE